MTPDPAMREALMGEYLSVLRNYLAGGGESALTLAYELGRKAATAGLGVLDIAMVHHKALHTLVSDDVGQAAAFVGLASQFLTESLSPFEMTLRSYRANAQLLGL